MMPKDIFTYIKTEEARFENDDIQVGENWYWNFRNHVQLIFHLKNGVFYTGDNDWMRAFKNIMEPMLQLAYWTEDIEVKDVTFFIEGDEDRASSFLLKKYHDEVFVREHDLDTFFDEVTESDIDYGGVLAQKTKSGRPEVLPLNIVAFCDQTDILGGPIGFKHYFSPSKLKSMESAGWGKPENGATISLDELCVLATQDKQASGTQDGKKNEVSGKTIEVYIVRGDLPESYLNEDGDPDYFCPQVHVVAFYTDKKGNKQGVVLYRNKEVEDAVMFHTCKKIHGRALGRGVGESLLHPQVWTNFLTIHKTQMLASGAKTPLVTDDPSFSQKNKVQDMENNEVTTITPGASITSIPTVNTANVQLYERSIDEWYQHAQLSGAAFDPMMGKEASSGTTFRGQERLVAQGRGIHDRRRGQRAKFIEKIYRKWIIPYMVKEISKGKEFLATLSTEEMTWVADRVATNEANKRIKESMSKGELITPEEQKVLTDSIKEAFSKAGNKKLLSILKDEFKDADIRMGINIAGKQKDLANLSDKMLSIFQFIFANPQGFQQAMQIPALSSAFADIMEFSGLSIAEFGTIISPPNQQMMAPAQQAQPLTLPQAPAEA